MNIKNSSRGLSLTTTSAKHKPWAVEFSDSTTHLYTADQMHQKFGLLDVQPGASVEHKRRGRGIVTAARNPRYSKRDSLLVDSEHHGNFSAALPAGPELDDLQMSNGATTCKEFQRLEVVMQLPELISTQRPVRRALRPQPDQKRYVKEHHSTRLLFACKLGFAVLKMQKVA